MFNREERLAQRYFIRFAKQSRSRLFILSSFFKSSTVVSQPCYSVARHAVIMPMVSLHGMKEELL